MMVPVLVEVAGALVYTVETSASTKVLNKTTKPDAL